MIPAWLEALVLGIVQGLTEFIPVSSSGHLVLVPYLMGWEKHSLAFDVMLHVGTLGSLLLYFRGELLAIARGLTGLDRSEEGRTYRRVGLFIVPASIPIGLVGLTLAEQVESVFASPLTASLLLLVTAALLIGTERVRDVRVGRSTAVDTSGQTEGEPVRVAAGEAAREAGEAGEAGEATWEGDWRAGGAAAAPAPARAGLPVGIDRGDPGGTDLRALTLRQAMVVGLLQCVAVLPGISRSGATIAGGVFAGLTREAATRFSFLLVIPALVGATILSLPDLGDGGESTVELVVGMAAAFVSGYIAIAYLVKLVSRARLTGFAVYCVAASAVGVVGYLMLGPVSSA